jgi:hypothetical protein
VSASSHVAECSRLPECTEKTRRRVCVM